MEYNEQSRPRKRAAPAHLRFDLAFEDFYRDLRSRGQLPTWHRRRDARAQFVSRLGGSRYSDRTLRRIRFVGERGVSALRDAMDQRHLSIAAAFELAKLPNELQEQAVADPQLRKAVVRIIRSEGMAP